MLRESALNRLLKRTYVRSLTAGLVWLLAASVSIQATFLPTAGREWMAEFRQPGEEDSGSRQLPLEEELDEELTASASRESRLQLTAGGAPRFIGRPSKRCAAPRAGHSGTPVEMARRNGIGSLLRC